MKTYFFVINFLPFTNTVDVEVRLTAGFALVPLVRPLPFDILYDENEVKPLLGIKKSIIE